MGIEKKNLKRTMHFYYVTSMATLAQEPMPRGYEIYNFGRPFLGHHYYILRLSELCQGVELNIFEYINVYSRYDLNDHA